MISGHGTIETAVRATKLGAYDFLGEAALYRAHSRLVENAIDAKRLRQENRDLEEQFKPRSVIVGRKHPDEGLRQQIALMAATNGAGADLWRIGTGKELAAHAIHAQSLRKEETFVEVNCAAIPEDLIESELFGHPKASFAGQHRQGRQISKGARRDLVPGRNRRHESEDSGKGAADPR